MHFSNIKAQLITFSAFCFLLLITRMVYTQSFIYLFMGINLMLAWIPYGISLFIVKLNTRRNKFATLILLFLWFIFFPNAPYMVTDLFHLKEFGMVPMWYDLIMLLAFAYTGMMLAFYSLRRIHLKLLRHQHPVTRIALTFIIFFITGTGIYLGRYERWNSWEIVTQPKTLTLEFMQLLGDPNSLFQMFALSLVFGMFFTLLYMQIASRKNRNYITDKA